LCNLDVFYCHKPYRSIYIFYRGDIMVYSVKKQILRSLVFVITFSLLLSFYCICFGNFFNSLGNTLAVAAALDPMEKKRLLIDPGHGGEDGGTVGVNGVLEKDLNLSLSEVLGAILEFSGYEVVQTRKEDKMLYDRNVNYHGRKKMLDLKGRLEIAKTVEPDLFIGIHMNAFPEQKYSGLSVYYSKNQAKSKDAADIIRANVKSALQPENNRETKAASSNIYILDRITCPAILIECGFLSNPEECENLSSYDYRRELSFVLYSSLVSFLEE